MWSPVKTWPLLSAARGAIALILLFCPGVEARGWALTQYCPYSGQHYLYFNADGLRLSQKKMGLTVVARAPDWKLTMFNDNTRTYFQTTYADWKARGLKGRLTSFKRTHCNIDPRRGTTGVIAGVPATQYLIGPKSIQQWQTRPQPGWLVCWVANDITVPRQLANIITTQLGLPPLNSVPLKVESINSHGRKVTILDTQASRIENLTSSSFTCPATYRRVADDIDVLVPEETTQTAADLLNELSSDPATQKQLNQLLKQNKAARYPAAGQSHRQGLNMNDLLNSFLKRK